MSLIRYFFILLILASAPAPAETQPVQDSDKLVLMPGDILRVVIWREEDLSGDFQVDQDGTLVLPLLGKLQVDDRAWNIVKDDLMQNYLRELRNPSIELVPFRIVYVLGEVHLPGRYNVHPVLTLLHVVPGLLFMVLGPLQFVRKIRSSWIQVHR